jgi:hypothetical protein
MIITFIHSFIHPLIHLSIQLLLILTNYKKTIPVSIKPRIGEVFRDVKTGMTILVAMSMMRVSCLAPVEAYMASIIR